MRSLLVEVDALDPATDDRVTLRACSADDRRITNAGGNRWWPAMLRRPVLTHDWFDGDFAGDIRTGGATLTLAAFGLKRQVSDAPNLRLAAAPIRLYTFDPAIGTPAMVFQGKIASFGNSDERIQISAEVDTEPFKASALTLTYAGTGGAEGTADLKNRVKPWAFGYPENVEPVLINPVDSVFQVSAYGPIEGIPAVYERASSFGTSTGDHANYAALVAATIPPGRYATCLAQGMFRLGAPPAGLITADVQGDKPGGTWLRRTGAIINRVATNAGVATGSIDAASLAALDAAVNRNVSIYLNQQTSVMDLAQRMARPCNAAAGVSWLGELFVTRLVFGTPAATLNAQGRQRPPVLGCDEVAVQPPYWRIEMGGDRCWRPHQISEIAFFAEIIDTGDYDAAKTYREGNIVANQGARWLYINPTPTSGNAPPTLPTTTNSYWDLLTNRTDFGDIGGTKPEADATRGDNVQPNWDLKTDTTGYNLGGAWTRVTAPAGFLASHVLQNTVTAGAPGAALIYPRVRVTPNDWVFARVKVRRSAALGDLKVAANMFSDPVSGGAIGPLVGAIVTAVPTVTNDVQEFSIYGRCDANTRGIEIWVVDLAGSTIGTVQIGDARVASSQQGADVTADTVPRLELPTVQTFQAAFDGTISAGQQPRDLQVRRFRGNVDVTSSTSWSATGVGCTASINSGGVLTISSVLISGRVDITGTREGVPVSGSVETRVARADPPPASGSPTASGSISLTSDSASFVTAATATVTTTASGTSVSISSDVYTIGDAGFATTEVVWQRETSPGTWSDVGAVVVPNYYSEYFGFEFGYATISRTVTGLASSTAHNFRLRVRRTSAPVANQNYSGSFTVAAT